MFAWGQQEEYAMDFLLQQMGEYIIFILIAVCVVVGMITKAITTIAVSGARERTRREIAAYVAEGSMTPEHGEQLLKADASTLAESC